MSATDAFVSLSPPDTVPALLLKVEAHIAKALRSEPPFEPNGQANARSAAAYHFQSGGQRVRARLALAGGLALGLSENDSLCIACCAELLHNASLIHDDIQDKDTLRRGRPALWSQFCTNMAICSGDYLLSAAYGVMCGFSQPLVLPAMLALLHARTGTAIDGQCADLSLRHDQPEGLTHYLHIAKAKSGALLSLPLEMVLLASAQNNALPLAREACENFAVSYQIWDDLQDAAQDCVADGVADDVLDGARDGIKQAQSKCLNIVFILAQQNRLAVAESSIHLEISARNLGLQHLALCDATAKQMPHGAGAYLLALSAQLRSKMALPASEQTGP